MAKNYKEIYNAGVAGADSIALEQRFYLKEESARGTLVFPVGTDFLYHLPGGQITYEQPFESSPLRYGRHHTNIIVKKKSTSWNFSNYLMVNTAVAAGITELDPALRVLWKSLLGREQIPGGVVYDAATAPATTFSLYEVGDLWSRQSPGCFVQGGNLQMPGDGEATVEWTGNGKTTYFIGIGKSTTDDSTTNDVTLQAGEAERFVVGGAVMLLAADGVTRSADTPDGSPRQITAVNTSTDVITVNGAALADAAVELYLSYYEPETPDAIDEPQTGLVGSVAIAGLASQCVRSLGINMQNNHEVKDYCFGEDGLGSGLFIAGSRLTAEITMSLNMNAEVAGYFNNVNRFLAQDITAIVGDAATRHFQAVLPQVYFNVPGFSVPDEGSIPVEFSGTAYQTGLDNADEVTVSYL